MEKEHIKIIASHKIWVESNRKEGDRANLSGANLNGADLSGANLSDAYLSRANLNGANLNGADLRYANLNGVNLSNADLSRANLSRAYLNGADLSRANLSGANLINTDLNGVNLSNADLSRANLRNVQKDLNKILEKARDEVEGLLTALKEGRIDGSCYTSHIACLVGTIANIRHANYKELSGIEPDSNRPAERWFLAIRKGDTPSTSQIAAITEKWILEFLAASMITGVSND
jgi:uncharacterized protein YjbI with pentapeptide repeats